MLGNHYERIFDESLPTYLLELRKKTVMQLLPLMKTWEISGAPSFMIDDIFTPLLVNIAAVQAEDDAKRLADEIEAIKKDMGAQ